MRPGLPEKAGADAASHTKSPTALWVGSCFHGESLWGFPAAPAANLMYFACVPGTEQILSGLNGKYRHLMVMATLCLSKCEWKDILENCVLFLPPSSRDKQGTCLRGHQPGTFHE